jgi:hypothetical protein
MMIDASFTHHYADFFTLNLILSNKYREPISSQQSARFGCNDDEAPSDYC